LLIKGFKLLMQHCRCLVPLVQEWKQPLPQQIKVLLKPDLLGFRTSFENGLHTCMVAHQCQVKLKQPPSCIARSDTQSMKSGAVWPPYSCITALSDIQDASLVSTASGIGAVEAMHAAVVRYQLYEVGC